MSASHKRKYPEYKDSGRQWLKEIPSHWNTPKFGQVFRERRTKVSDKDFDALSVTKEGIVPQLATAAKTDHGDNRKLVLKGDFVINSRSDRKGSSGVSPLNGSVSTISIVLEILKGNNRYIHHLLRSHDFKEEFYRLGHGIVADLWSTRFDDIKGELLCFPPENEQGQISIFLDFADKAITNLVKYLQNMLAKLKEKRSSLITQAVTKGLNPDVPMKDSGIDWLGEIPNHWGISKFPYCVNYKEGPGILAVDFREQGVALLRIRNLKPGYVDLFDCNFLDEKMVNQKWKQFKVAEGDLLISGSASTGFVSIVDKDSVGAIPYTGIFRLRAIKDKIISNYVEQLVLSDAFLEQIRVMMTGSTIQHFGPSHLSEIVVALPPINEQIEISNFILEKAKLLDLSIQSILQQIEKLNEYRAALISAAVTGKIDVRRQA